MLKKPLALILFFWCFMTFNSCLQVAAEVKNWMEASKVEEVVGTYHYLDNDGIKIFLPEVFERYSAVEYQQLLDSLVTKKEFEFESRRLKQLRELEGNLYLYFDKDTRSTYTIHTMPYTPMTKRDAQYVLGIISASYDKSTKHSDLGVTKLNAKFSDTKNQSIFKSVHRIDNSKAHTEIYNTTYIITSNNKTIWLQLTTPFEVDFDMFIQKMIM